MSTRTPQKTFLSYPSLTPLSSPVTETLNNLKPGKYSSGIPVQTESGLLFASKNGWVEVTDFFWFGYKSQQVMLVQEKSILEFSLADRSMTSFSFDYFSLHSPDSKVSLYDDSGNLIASIPLNVTGSPSAKNFVINQFSYTAPPGVKIGRVEIIAGNEPAVGDAGFNIDNISWGAADPLPVTIMLDSMSKDTGSSALDFITNDGSAGRNVSGSLSRYLGKDEVMEWWNGSTWQQVKVSGQSWSLIDNVSHSADWQYQLRIVNSGVAGAETTFDITLDTTPADVRVLFTSMTKDNGADELDWKTTNGSAGRKVSGNLDKPLDVGDIIEYSFDGRTWQSLTVESDLSWSFVDPLLHTADWQYLIRIIDLAGNQTQPTVQMVELFPESAIITRISDNVGTVQTDVADGAMTDDRTPTLYGTAPPGSLVTIYDGTEKLTQVFVDKNGNWQWTPSANLHTDHQYDFSAVASLGGRSAQPSDTHSIIIVPAASITQLIDDVGTETGAQINGATIDDGTPELRGRALAESTVYLYDNGKLIATVKADKDGSWKWDSALTYPGGVDLGPHSITVEYEKDGYNSDISAPWTFTYQPPAPTTLALIDEMTKDSGINNDFITNDGSAVRKVSGTLTAALKSGEKVQFWDGTNWQDASVVGTTWTANDNNAHASNWQYKTRVINTTNTAGPEVVQDVILDVTPPSEILVQFTSMTKDNGTDTNDWKTSDGSPGRTVYGKLNKSLQTEYFAEYSIDNGASWQRLNIQNDLSWSFTDTQSYSADWQYQVRITDIAGNSAAVVHQPVDFITPPGTPAITEILDNVAGGIVGNLRDGSLTNDNTPTVKGIGQPNGKIILVMTRDNNDWSSNATRTIEVQVDENGNWQTTIDNLPLEDGEWYFRPKSVDSLGNEGPLAAEWEVIVDTVTPQPQIKIAQDFVAGGKQNGEDIGNTGVTNDPSPVLKGNAEAGSLVRFYDRNNREIGSTIVGTDGEWTFKLPTQTNGQGSFTAIATDEAGNISQPSDPYVINFETFMPAPTITAGLDDFYSKIETILRGKVTNDVTPEFYGKGQANALILVYDHGIPLGSVYADANGNWNLPLPELQKGEHSLTAVAKSAEGVTSKASTPYDFKVGYLAHFNDYTMGGWQLIGAHASRSSTYISRNQLMFETPVGYNYSGDIMRKTIDVVAGKTYDFSFILTKVSSWTLDNPAILAFKVNGQLVSSYYTVQNTPQTVIGSWKSTITGKVTLSITNAVATGVGNDFLLDDISIVPRHIAGPVTPIKQMMLSVDNVRDELQENITAIKSLATEANWEEVKTGGLHNGIIDTLNVTGENQQLSLSDLRQHLKAVNTIDITGHGNNTLSISLEDILALGGDELFVGDKTLQLQIRGDDGDVVNLNSVFKGEDFGHWTQQNGSVTISGVSYNIFKHDSLDVELVVEDGIKSNLI